MGVNQDLLKNIVQQGSPPSSSTSLNKFVFTMDSYFPISRGNPSHYLRLYFNFCYYSCIIPFRFEFDVQRNTYHLKTHVFQKFCCLVTLLCCLLEEVITLRKLVEDIHFPEDGKDDPIVYFEIFNSFSNVVYYFTVIRTIWCKSARFLALMKILTENERESRYRADNLKAKLWISLTLCGFLIYPASFIAGFFLRRSYSGWTEIIDIWSTHAARVFFLEKLIPDANFLIKIIFAIFRIGFLLCYTQITTAMEVLLLQSAMLLHDAVSDFRELVKDTSVGSMQILEEYTQLRNVSRKLNKSVGVLTFGLTLACLPYYIVNLLEFIKPANAAVFFRHLLFFVNVFGFLILATLTHKKALILQEWLLTTRNFSDIPIPRLCVLLHDMAGGNIGLSGSGFFKVTTGFLGTIISLLLTFSIIIIQFKTSDSMIAVNVIT